MRHIILSIILILTTFTVPAQVKVVNINMYGDFIVEVDLPNNGFVILNQYGQIIDLSAPNLSIEMYSDFHEYESGKIMKISDIRFKYYSDFNDYKSGKIESIGDTRFDYYSDFWDYESGKLKSIGGVNISYHSNFWDYESGKIKSIGSYKFSYLKSGAFKSGILDFAQKDIHFIVRPLRGRY